MADRKEYREMADSEVYEAAFDDAAEGELSAAFEELRTRKNEAKAEYHKSLDNANESTEARQKADEKLYRFKILHEWDYELQDKSRKVRFAKLSVQQ